MKQHGQLIFWSMASHFQSFRPFSASPSSTHDRPHLIRPYDFGLLIPENSKSIKNHIWWWNNFWCYKSDIEYNKLQSIWHRERLCHRRGKFSKRRIRIEWNFGQFIFHEKNSIDGYARRLGSDSNVLPLYWDPWWAAHLSLVTIKDFLIKIGKMGTDALIITDGPDWMRQFLHPLAFKYRIKLNQFFHRFTGLFRLRRCPDSPDFRFEKGLPKLCSKYANSFWSRGHNGTS